MTSKFLLIHPHSKGKLNECLKMFRGLFYIYKCIMNQYQRSEESCPWTMFVDFGLGKNDSLFWVFLFMICTNLIFINQYQRSEKLCCWIF